MKVLQSSNKSQAKCDEMVKQSTLATRKLGLRGK